MKAAKIATYSLVTYIIFALSLISPMGVSGLALASTVGGFVSFTLTIKVFGVKEFFEMLVSKNALYLVVGAVIFTALLLVFRDFVQAYV